MEFRIVEKTKILNKEVDVVEGGFGEGQRVLLTPQISQFHDQPLKAVNQLIKKNLNSFKEDELRNVAKDANFKAISNDLGINITNATKYVFLLSERGYMRLVTLFRNDQTSKHDVVSEVIENYFGMRKQLNKIKLQDEKRKKILAKLLKEVEDVIDFSVKCHHSTCALILEKVAAPKNIYAPGKAFYIAFNKHMGIFGELPFKKQMAQTAAREMYNSIIMTYYNSIYTAVAMILKYETIMFEEELADKVIAHMKDTGEFYRLQKSIDDFSNEFQQYRIENHGFGIMIE